MDLIASFGVTLLCLPQPGISLLIWPYLLQAVCPVNDHKHTVHELCFSFMCCKLYGFNVFSFIHIAHMVCGLIVTRCFFLIFSLLKEIEGKFDCNNGTIAPLFTVNFVSLRPRLYPDALLEVIRERS